MERVHHRGRTLLFIGFLAAGAIALGAPWRATGGAEPDGACGLQAGPPPLQAETGSLALPPGHPPVPGLRSLPPGHPPIGAPAGRARPAPRFDAILGPARDQVFEL